MLHIMRAHLQIMLWKAADQREPPCRDQITTFGWEVTKEGAVMPAVPTKAVAPVNWLDAVALH